MDDTDGELPEAFASLLDVGSERLVSLYNGLAGLDDEAFADAFAGALTELQGAVDPKDTESAAVLGLTLDGGTVVDARLLSVRSSEDGTVRYAAEGEDVPDIAVYLPVRPHDFPPGSGEDFADIGVEEFREVVSAMLYLQYQLAQDDPERLASHYQAPLERGLQAYVDA